MSSPEWRWGPRPATIPRDDESERSDRLLLGDSGLPVIVLIGGTTGTGKSTVASEVAYRLGITRVTSTDFIRETMRAFLSYE